MLLFPLRTCFGSHEGHDSVASQAPLLFPLRDILRFPPDLMYFSPSGHVRVLSGSAAVPTKPCYCYRSCMLRVEFPLRKCYCFSGPVTVIYPLMQAFLILIQILFASRRILKAKTLIYIWGITRQVTCSHLTVLVHVVRGTLHV